MNEYQDTFIGSVFGRLTVIGKGEKRGDTQLWVCRCQCGNVTKTATRTTLNAGRTKSCGCLRRDIAHRMRFKHGLSSLPEYSVWRCAVRRCSSDKNYVTRGISVCPAWKDFEAFLKDMGKRPSPKHTIERIDNNGNYEPGNCRWATRKEQARNRRTNHVLVLDGRSMCITDWALETGLELMTIVSRLKSGWNLRDALLVPSLTSGKAKK